jgi:hypothetical protein
LLAKDWEDDVDLSSVIRDYHTQQLLGNTFVITHQRTGSQSKGLR